LVKRDDLTGLALGGNKARKLELLCAEALAQGCDTLVTGGGSQSNHARMTAAAANRRGLECHLAVAGPRPAAATGNLLLDRILGAHLHFTGERGYYETETAILELARGLAAEGRQPYAIPIGGASVTGALAYVAAADELLGQAAVAVESGDTPAPPVESGDTPAPPVESGDTPAPPVDWVVVADGSGGTHAGLLAGLPGGVAVLGIDVGTRPDLDERVPEIAAEAATAAGRPPPTGPVVIDHDHFGPGYGKPTAPCLEAIRAAARLEGLILDPVYTGKALAGLIGWARDGRFGPDTTVVFWHTGGAPALFAEPYGAWLAAED
jgi:1-aminocyclopropane-1-carboxylate deaminase/D-cysteine desulfhydrase-like pyridoxal-dependent ACC family enzyme